MIHMLYVWHDIGEPVVIHEFLCIPPTASSRGAAHEINSQPVEVSIVATCAAWHIQSMAYTAHDI